MADATRRLVQCIALPPQLPQSSKEDDPGDEPSHMVGFWHECIAEFETIFRGDSAFHGALKEFALSTSSLHSSQLSSPAITSALNRLKPGDAFTLFIKEQNCGMLFHRVDESNIELELFEASADNASIMSSQSSLKRDYPGTALRLPTEFLLQSQVTEELSQTLADFSVQAIEMFQSHVRKAKANVVEPRDSCSPAAVTNALTSVLLSYGSTIQVVSTNKKIRDEVCWNNSYLPWRRPPVWAVLKVGLQRWLEKTNGREHGWHIYKNIQAVIMAKLCSRVATHESLSDDLFFVKAKLARRLDKLRTSNSLDADVDSFACDALEGANAVLDTRWENVIKTNTRQVPRCEQAKPSDTKLLLRNSSGGIGKRLASTTTQQGSSYNGPASSPHRHKATTNSTKLRVYHFPNADHDRFVALYDFEQDVLSLHYNIAHSDRECEQQCEAIDTMFSRYEAASARLYESNIDLLSVRKLTLMLLWMHFDRLALRLVPLLQHLSPQIPTNFMRHLRLATKDHLTRVKEIEEYVEQRTGRTSKTSRYDPFADYSIKEFACIFYDDASSGAPLRNLRAKIDQDTAKRVAALRAEWNKKEQDCRQWQQQAAEIAHEQYEDRYDNLQCTARCNRCRLNNLVSQTKILPFEEPLPKAQESVKWVLFELLCPGTVLAWRDLTWRVLSDLGRPAPTSETSFSCELVSYVGLRTFHQRATARLRLVSEKKSFYTAHYANRSLRVVDTKFSQVHLPHGPDWFLHDGKADIAVSEVRNEPSLLFWKYPGLLPQDGRYKACKASIMHTTHTPNQVMSNLTECHPLMSLFEFHSFNVLRSGDSLQWMNMLVELCSPSLEFAEDATYRLFTQSTLELGPATADLDVYRKAHQWFQDAQFCQKLLQLITRRVSAIKSNWNEIPHLRTMLILTLRLEELAPSLRDIQAKCQGVRLMIRTASLDWTRRIQADIRNAESSETQFALRRTQFSAALLCRATYICTDGLAEWGPFFESGFILANERPAVLADAKPHVRHEILHDWALACQVESVAAKAGQAQPAILSAAVGVIWPAGQSIKHWTPLPTPNGRWLWAGSEPTQGKQPMRVDVNILTGDLLVEGQRPDRLPKAYLEDPQYRELFRTRTFETLPSDVKGMKFTSNTMYGLLHFGWDEDGIKIGRESAGGRIDLLIPRALFGSYGSSLSQDLPNSLVNGQIHWLNLVGSDSGTIYICPLARAFAPQEPSDWRLVFPQRRAEQDSGQTVLLEPNGEVVTRMATMIGQLESRYNIVATLDETKKTTVSMPRFGLTMQLTSDGQLFCPDLNGLLLDVQKPSTFIGLSGHLLMAENTGTEFLVIPHGKLVLSQVGGHTKAVANSGTASTVVFSKFVINQCLGRLDCNAESRDMLLKAYLHAVCSGHLPDPLTKRRGVEEAIHILQELYRQIYKPLEADVQILLDSIANLTPTRVYYPPGMQVMQNSSWNPNLAAATQLDEFRDAVSQIIKRSNDLSAFQDGAEDLALKLTHKSEDRLHKRSRLRNSKFLPPRSSGSLSEETASPAYSGRDALMDNEKAQRVYALSALIKAWSPEIDCTNELGALMDNLGDFKGFHTALPRTSPASLFSLQVVPQLGSVLEMCRQATQAKDQFRLLFLFPLLAYGKGNDEKILRAMLAIAINSECHQIKPPSMRQYTDFRHWQRPSQTVLYNSLIHSDHKPNAPTLYQLSNEKYKTFMKRQADADRQHQAVVNAEATQMARVLLQQWPCPATHDPRSSPTRVRYSTAAEEYRPHWNQVWANWQLSEYFSKVSAIVCGGRDGVSIQFPSIEAAIRPLNKRVVYAMGGNSLASIWNFVKADSTFTTVWPKSREPCLIPPGIDPPDEPRELYELDGILNSQNFKDQPVRAEFAAMHQHSLQALRTCANAAGDPPTLRREQHLDDIESAERLVQAKLSGLEELAKTHPSFRHLGLGGFWPRMTVADMLQLLVNRSDTPLSEELEASLLDLAVSVIDLQRLRRLLRLHQQNDQVRLKEELACQYHTWDLRRFKEWLILEIEMDVCIRKEQAEMAFSMARPDSDANTIYQLQMGKGKSSLIIPMVAAILPSKESLVRVVVTKPLLHQMGAILKQRVSRILGRPLLHIPFSRPTRKDSVTLNNLKTLHEHILNSSGVVLTLPEHMQSLQLSGIQCLLDRRLNEGHALLEMYQWLQRYSRDVLDECDHILSPRTQLIYPSGTQTLVDGGSKRWTAIADILDYVFTTIHEYAMRRPEHVEVEQRHHSSAVPIIHFRTEHGGIAFNDYIVDLMTDPVAPSLPLARLEPDKWPELRSYIKNGPLSASTMQMIKLKFDDADAVNKFLVMRGILGGGILLLALQKRWNVSYGLHLDRCQIAVPYLARGRPSPASEFGHPDVAIVLTFLAYYHQGLSQKQFHLAIEKLRLENDPTLEWDTWLKSGHQIADNHKSWHAVNIDDEGLMFELWRGLSYSRKAVNYYLDRVVFPRAAREFERKLVSSSWDLPLRTPRITTGFSGTNDNGKLMPASIVAKDLPMQGHTNAEVLQHLLQPRNRQYKLAADSANKALSVEGLLDLAVDFGVDVFLDAGALVLEMSNIQVATEWLKRRESAKAAVYFNEKGMLSVAYRNGQTELLSKSRYASNLAGCLLYLDEEHCRGTDTKLPAQARAVLTIGPKQPKDQTVQAAMRLRQLAHGQSLLFLAPPAVDHSIRDFCQVGPNATLDSSHVISWSIAQSCIHIEAHISLWKHQQRSFQLRQERTDTVYSRSNDAQLEAVDRVPEQEKRTLAELYGPQMLIGDLEATRVVEVDKESETTLDRACAEEEQERQVDQEVQEQQQRQRPPPEKPCVHRLHQPVRDFILHGIRRPIASTPAYRSAFRHMAQSKALSKPIGHNFAGLEHQGRVLVTVDFCQTVQLSRTSNVDESLRPVRYLAWTRKQPDYLMIISPYEAEQLIPEVKDSSHAHILLYEAPRTRAMIDDFYELNHYGVPQLPLPGEIPKHLRQELFLYAGASFFPYNDGEAMRTYMRELNKLIDPQDKRRSSTDIGSSIAEVWGKWLQLRMHGMNSQLSPAGYLIQDQALNPTDRVFGG